MKDQATTSAPLVSVIIPCYNHARYLPKAVESVFSQNFPGTEVVVVDDGSKDDTREVCTRLEGVRYIYQENAGLSAARNRGIRESKGDLLIFLDADDWLYPDSISINSKYLLEDPELAFVSGAHNKVNDEGDVIDHELISVEKDYYLTFLQMNYIGMHATVMYRRWVFERVQFDTTLRACEDYDVYLKVSRKYPVKHHSSIIAAYRWHTENMSANIPLMLEHVLKVLNRQKVQLMNSREVACYRKGVKIWTTYYGVQLYRKSRNTPLNASELKLLRKYKPTIYLRCLIRTLVSRRG